MNLDNKIYYLDRANNLVLIIPQEYIKSNIPSAVKLNALDQAQACGFNPDVLTPLTHSNPEYLLQQLKLQQSKSVNKNQFINHLTALFIPQEEGRKPLSP